VLIWFFYSLGYLLVRLAKIFSGLDGFFILGLVVVWLNYKLLGYGLVAVFLWCVLDLF